MLCCVSIGTYAWASQPEASIFNKDLVLKEISGTAIALGEVQVKNIVKVGVNQYEEVTFSKDGVAYTPTSFDANYGVGKEVLDHKKLFRGHVRSPYIDTSEDKILLTQFNPQYPYASSEATVEIRIEDMKTGKVISESRTLNDIKIEQYVMKEQLFEVDGKIIYVLQMHGNEQKMLIYEINPNGLTIQLLTAFTVNESHYNTEFVSDGKALYTILSTGKELEYTEINVHTGEMSGKKFQLEEGEDTNFSTTTPERFTFNGKELVLAYNGENGIHYFVFDRKNLKQKDSFRLSPVENVMNYGHSMSDWKLTDTKFYMLEQIYTEEIGNIYHAGVYDLSTQKVEFEGQLPAQVMNNYHWVDNSSVMS